MSDLDKCKKYLRSILLASKGGVPAGNVFESYKDMVGEGIPYRKFNYQTLEQFLQSMPDVCRITARGRDIVVVGVANNETHHIGEMVRKQGGKSMGGSKDKKEDKKSRPLQDARIVKCGELIPKKKVQSSEDESSSSSSSEDEEEKIRKKLKKQKKKAKKAAKKAAKKEKAKAPDMSKFYSVGAQYNNGPTSRKFSPPAPVTKKPTLTNTTQVGNRLKYA